MTRYVFLAELVLESEDELTEEQALDELLELMAETVVEANNVLYIDTIEPESFDDIKWENCWGGGYE